MTLARLTLLMVLVAAAAGCDGASSASEAQSDVATTSGSGGNDAAPTQLRSDESGGAAPSAPAVVTPAGIVEATFDDIKFPMEKTDAFTESMLTDRVRELFDQRIRIRGYMYPTPRRKGLKQFVLVRDNMECCFGPGAALFDCILVTMVGDATAEFSIRPIAVEGEFRLEVLPGPDGRPLAIYQMAGEAVK